MRAECKEVRLERVGGQRKDLERTLTARLRQRYVALRVEVGPVFRHPRDPRTTKYKA